jgi:hypothetical protein
MRISLLCSVASLLLASTVALAQGEGEFPATLAGHAVLPAQSFIDAPADAPDDLKTSGKYTTGRRVDASMRRQRQQPAVLLKPRSQQGRRQ